MIFSKTAFRLSLQGGGTDYEPFYQKFGGVTVGGTINKYSYLVCRKLPKFFSYKTRLAYSQIELIQNNKDISHKGILAVVDHLKMIEESLEITHLADLPSYSGLGTSSAFTVGLINALSVLKKDYKTPRELAEEAIFVERKLIGENIGVQDQYFAAFGGLNVFKISKDGEVTVQPMNLSKDHIEELESHLLLFFTNIPRKSSEIAGSYIHTLGNNKHLCTVLDITDKTINAIFKKDWENLGKLVSEGWQIKRGLSSQVTNILIDKYYKTGIGNGAWGGKLLGSGGGGMLAFIAPKENHTRIINKMKLLHIPFRFSHRGSTVWENGDD